MNTIAAINFRGGVGKTTIIWLLAKYLAEKKGKKVLVVDIDSQMSLTSAIRLEGDNGALNKEFNQWYNQYKNTHGIIVNAIDSYQKSGGAVFDFVLNPNCICKMSEHLSFIPATIDLFWLEFDILNRELMKSFITTLLNKLSHSGKYNFDYVFFDCPPAFNNLTNAVLSSANMILIPFNPDVLASKELIQLIEGLAQRLKPWPNLNLSVLMNKAQTYGKDYLTSDSKHYLAEVKAAQHSIESRGIKIKVLDNYVPSTVDIRNKLTNAGFPSEFEPHFSCIWEELAREL
ncbi:MAG: Cobyrinic acid ac-diamide synthase [Ignavibacteria bacterium]|nr:Cobyrinic acid ac-diamide synthase [Ignavibacteria bacterium]